MAEVLQPQASTDAHQQRESKDTLARSLDDLLEVYLHLLDNYQKLRQGLHDNLSSGYMSLAQANFSNPNRIRYCQDYYDDRMQASTQITIENEKPYFKAIDTLITSRPNGTKIEEQDSPQQSKKNKDQHTDDAPQEADKGSSSFRDPLHWFGVLIPPALRASQNHFKNATIEIIPTLVSLEKELKEVEIEVRRTRKKLKKAS